MITVRVAEAADALAMSRVLVASITQLCAPDHRNDPTVIAAWTRNKSPESISVWVADPQKHVLLAEAAGGIVAVGCLNSASEIGLNYVDPTHRFAGVSTLILAALEDAMRARGTTLGLLTSTSTAHRFYLSRGWRDTGPAQLEGTVASYPMSKAL